MMEAVYLGFEDGSISPEVYRARMKGLKLAVERNPFLGTYWQHWRQYDFTEAFVRYVDSEVLQQDA